MTQIRKNERSWAIDLITTINSIVNKYDLKIKKAGGESTISIDAQNRMFPDVILYGDKEQTIILQGWELKMPDVSIDDTTFIKDAQRKAIALNLNSCLIWNFTYAVLYVREDGDQFKILKQWSETSHITSRQDVEHFRVDWEKLIEKVLFELNEYFLSGELRNTCLGEAVSDAVIPSIIRNNKLIVSENMKQATYHNSVMEADISAWWSEIKSEYEKDEEDPYNAYAKVVMLNWINRIVFGHILKNKWNGAMIINKIKDDITPEKANRIFEQITSKYDFYNIFKGVKYNEFLPESTWHNLVELSAFLKENGISCLNQDALQKILEGTIALAKREINGQYTTPVVLADLLTRLTIVDWADDILDCCCGTGTIASAVIRHKREKSNMIKEAISTVWACDKFAYPLQIANMSMTSPDAINMANRLFQHNALSLKVGDVVTIVNPEIGKEEKLSLPQFGAIVSNLPFVSFESISNADKKACSDFKFIKELDKKSDLYCYIAIKISEMIKPGGMLGIIVSNSWLGTNAGRKFVEIMKKIYEFRQIHISGKGRWFKNADVVTTIVVLQKKGTSVSGRTAFWVWNKTLDELRDNLDYQKVLINSALLEKEIDTSVSKLTLYSEEELKMLCSLNISYNAFFYDIKWLLDIKCKLIPIDKVFRVFRGSRRGWDALFYPRKGAHNIERIYLKKVLLNAKQITTLIAKAEDDAFCCDISMEELKKKRHNGALRWIERFVWQKNKVGRPLPQVLAKHGRYWYQMSDNEIAEIFTMMNPDKRIFFSKFDTPSFINQRLIGLVHKEDYPDVELEHALLNSIITSFCVEASGFGRGLGVLDISKEKIAKCYMLNPKGVNALQREKIIKAFNNLKQREIMTVSEEFNDEARLAFEHEVLSAFGIDEYFERIKDTLLALQKMRATVKT